MFDLSIARVESKGRFRAFEKCNVFELEQLRLGQHQQFFRLRITAGNNGKRGVGEKL